MELGSEGPGPDATSHGASGHTDTTAQVPQAEPGRSTQAQSEGVVVDLSEEPEDNLHTGVPPTSSLGGPSRYSDSGILNGAGSQAISMPPPRSSYADPPPALPTQGPGAPSPPVASEPKHVAVQPGPPVDRQDTHATVLLTDEVISHLGKAVLRAKGTQAGKVHFGEVRDNSG